MSAGEKRVFAAGPVVVAAFEDRSALHRVVDGVVMELQGKLPISGQVMEISESANPETGVPGAVIVTSESCYFMDFEKFDVVDLSLHPLGESKSVFFNGFKRVFVENSELVCQTFGEDVSNSMEEVPIDSFFMCATAHHALLVSREASLALLVSAKGTSEFPSGYVGSMVCAAFFDEDSVAFASSEKEVMLVRDHGAIECVRVDADVQAIDVADLNCYERSVVCLDADGRLGIVQFSSKSFDVLEEGVVGFAIVHDPFDVIVAMKEGGGLVTVRGKQSSVASGTMKDVIYALDSRIVSGLAELAETRRRATMRRKLAMGQNVELPHMVTIFGEMPQKKDATDTKQSTGPNLWVENVQGLEFEIHCDVELPMVCDVVVASTSCVFMAACVSSPINEHSLRVSVEIEVEKMSKYDGFSVFLRSDGCMYYAGKVEFAIRDVISAKGIMRLREDFFVNFPPHFVPQDLPDMCEPVDNGVILHLQGSTFEKFEMMLVSLAAQLPEDSVYQRKVKTHMQTQIAKEATRYVRNFPQAVSRIAHNEQVPKHVFVDMKTWITDLLASIIW